MIPEIDSACFLLTGNMSSLPHIAQASQALQLRNDTLLTIDKVSDAYQEAQRNFFSEPELVAGSLENLSSSLDTSLFAVSAYKTPEAFFSTIPQKKIFDLLHLAQNARELTISAICKHCLRPGTPKLLNVSIQEKALKCLNSIRHEIPSNRQIHYATIKLNDPETACHISFPELDRMIEAFYRIQDTTAGFLYSESKKDR